MKNARLFDIIGPRMIGPSSSHTAGAARIGIIAGKLLGEDVKKAKIVLYESFATTGRGHGTDRAIVGGLLGFSPEDERLKNSFEIARDKGLDIQFEFSMGEAIHPNTARIEAIGKSGEKVEVLGISVGGGNIEIIEVNGMQVSFNCEYPTLLVFHTDVPGVISKITAVLMEEGINIAFMKVFRTSRNDDASMVIETDENVPRELIPKILDCAPGIKRVSVI